MRKLLVYGDDGKPSWVARMEKTSQNPRHRWKDNIIMISGSLSVRVGIRFMWPRTGLEAGSCEHSNQPWGSIKMGNSLNPHNNYQLLKNAVQWSNSVSSFSYYPHNNLSMSYVVSV
jgi:hypothetical protein